MCIIIDANSASKTFKHEPAPESAIVLRSIMNGQLRVVIGGKALRELQRIEAARRWLVVAFRAGHAIRVPDEAVEREMAWAVASGLCESDDEHVIALARAGGARAVFTDDELLMRDFKNPRLIAGPRGIVITKPFGAFRESAYRARVRRIKCSSA